MNPSGCCGLGGCGGRGCRRLSDLRGSIGRERNAPASSRARLPAPKVDEARSRTGRTLSLPQAQGRKTSSLAGRTRETRNHVGPDSGASATALREKPIVSGGWRAEPSAGEPEAGSRQASQEGRPATSITGGDSRARRNVVISEPSRLPGPLRATSLEPRRRLAGQKPSSPRDSDLMALRSRTPPRARPCHCFRHRRVRPPSSGNTLRRSFRRQRSPRWGQPDPKSSRQTSHCRSSPANGPGSWRSRFDHSGHPNQG